MSAVERGSPRRSFLSHDGTSQIVLIPVMQDGKVVSYYVQVTQRGSQTKPDVVAEVNLGVERVIALGEALQAEAYSTTRSSLKS